MLTFQHKHLKITNNFNEKASGADIEGFKSPVTLQLVCTHVRNRYQFLIQLLLTNNFSIINSFLQFRHIWIFDF